TVGRGTQLLRNLILAQLMPVGGQSHPSRSRPTVEIVRLALVVEADLLRRRLRLRLPDRSRRGRRLGLGHSSRTRNGTTGKRQTTNTQCSLTTDRSLRNSVDQTTESSHY